MELQRACDSCGVHKDATRWLFTSYPSGTTKDPAKTRLSAFNAKATCPHEGMSHYYADAAKFFLKHYATDDIIATADEKIRNHRQDGLTPREFVQSL